MTLSDLSSIGSLVSGIAVLVSLIYLAQQTRQNSKHTRALIQQGRASLAMEIPIRFAEDAELTELTIRGDNGDLSLNEIQIRQYMMLRGAVFHNWEDQFHQHRDGLLDGNRFGGTVKLIETQFRHPGPRCAWKTVRASLYGTEFQLFMDEILDRTQIGTNADFSMAWKAGIEEVERLGRNGL